MADLKSGGVKYVFKCLKCESEFHTKCQRFTEGLNCPKCRGPLNPTGEKIKQNIGGFVIDIDVSNALKGLKAVQREARKTIKLLKEVDSLTNKN